MEVNVVDDQDKTVLKDESDRYNCLLEQGSYGDKGEQRGRPQTRGEQVGDHGEAVYSLVKDRCIIFRIWGQETRGFRKKK